MARSSTGAEAGAAKIAPKSAKVVKTESFMMILSDDRRLFGCLVVLFVG